MNSLASTANQAQSLLHTPTNTAAAGLANPSGAGSTAVIDQQPQSPHSFSPGPNTNDTSIDTTDRPSNVPSSSDSRPLTPLVSTEVLAPSLQPMPEAQDKDGKDGADVALIDPVSIKEEGEVLLEPINGQIELLEHTPDSVVGAAEAGVIINEDNQDWVDPDHELKRVKVYELIGSRWQDQGTAFCFGQFSEETNEALLIARSERNYHDIILSTAIRSNDVYQRQQDTLIVWTEPDGVDYALSFQDPEGCAEVWNFILEVQRHMNNSDDPANISSPILGPDTSVTTASIIRSGHLPAPQLGIISEIERAIKALARAQAVKERICEYIQQEDYIKSLIDVMTMAEDLESLENLHALCSIMQTILMLNDHGMYEHILEDDIFFGVVGMLEYDPDFPGHKANYRDFLHSTSQYHQPIPLRDHTIQRKIHHTYRLQFLKDVVLARALDDSTHNVLNSCIIFNQIDIITHVQQDSMFLRDVVRLFVDEEMLAGGGGVPPGAKRIPIQGQQVQPHPHPQLQQHQQHQASPQSHPQPQHIIISLNSNGDNVTNKPDTPMDVDPKPEASAPKPMNGSLPLVNGRPAQPKHRSGSYAFAPPDNLTEEEISLRREVIILLQQLCIMGKNVQVPARMALFRTLVDRGILFAVQWALGLPEKEDINKQMISAAGEVLTALLDHDLNGVRGHVLKQVVAIEKEREAKKKGADKAETILEMSCRIMAQSKDLAVQSQVGDALKTWMDVPPLDSLPGVVAAGSEAIGPKPPTITRKDDPGTERYMDYFYKDCTHILMKPFADLPEWKGAKESVYLLTREQGNRYVYLCDLLHNFLLQHHFRSHFYVMSSNILPRVATLLKAKDKHLRHSAFRIFRLLLKQNNPNSHSHIMKHDILKPILDLTIRESRRDNLLSCSCQEYFENMRRENMKDLIKFCMTRHESEIQELAQSPLGTQRFQLLIRRWEMNNEPLPEEPKTKPADARNWPGQPREPDRSEDDYFNADDEEEPIPALSHPWMKGAGSTSPLPSNNTGMKRKRRPAAAAATKGYRPPLKTPQLGALVDYEGDEDEPSPTATEEAPPRSEGSKSPPDLPPRPSTRSQSVPPLSTPTAPPTSTPSGPPPKRSPKAEDDDDNLLEALARPKARSESPAPGPMRPSEKRRRIDDDDDDELLQRITKQSKKSTLGNQKDSSTPAASTIQNRTKNGDDPPAKKIKVKLGAVGLSFASLSPTPTTPTTPVTTPSSEEGTKEEDVG